MARKTYVIDRMVQVEKIAADEELCRSIAEIAKELPCASESDRQQVIITLFEFLLSPETTEVYTLEDAARMRKEREKDPIHTMVHVRM